MVLFNCHLWQLFQRKDFKMSESQKTTQKVMLTALVVTAIETVLAFCLSIALGTVDVYLVYGLIFVASPIFLLNYFLTLKTNVFDVTQKEIDGIKNLGKVYSSTSTDTQS